ncbi:MAG: tRNA epoxyqueuosine(34) reductase QueG [Bacteroidia bacterium]|nr:tRNA epoxyqueuosine(34) reductase QueG [Bacteroidia bacterium]NNM16150.1 tRNA epoxyqueuosine(34) reductase QueG [Bacteroidia bacterium]
MGSLQAQHSQLVKETAKRLGFSFCGISKAEFLEKEAVQLEEWLKNGMHGKMQYMENYFDMRLDPRKLVPGAKSVISLLLNYFPTEEQKENAPKISRYAYGEDYHKVIKKKLKEFVSVLSDEVGEINGRSFVDSAPVLDKAWAQKSGLGWMGKNTNIIHPKQGSYFFISEIISDLELEYDNPIQDYCGTCTACIDACPTDAIAQPYVVDGSKCISYFTIELKDEVIPKEVSGKFENWFFGCDICQEVCPWNRFSKPNKTKEFIPKKELLEMNQNEWMEITEDVFENLFQKSAVKRTGYKGLKRNLEFLKKTS